MLSGHGCTGYSPTPRRCSSPDCTSTTARLMGGEWLCERCIDRRSEIWISIFEMIDRRRERFLIGMCFGKWVTP